MFAANEGGLRYDQHDLGMVHIPGRRANMFGSVLPIQNNKWNCVHVRRTNITAVGLPNRLETARRRRQSPTAFALASTIRATRSPLSMHGDIDAG